MQYFPIPIVFASGTAKNNRYLDEYFKKTRLYERRTGKSYESTLNNDKVPVPLTDIERIFEAVYIFIIERKRIKKISFSKKVLYCLTWPIFDIIGRYTTYIALFNKIEWKPIPHESKITIDDLK